MWIPKLNLTVKRHIQYKLIDDFVNMVEYTEKVSRKKFRNISDKNLDKIIEQIEIVKRNKESTLHLMFNGPKSFVGNFVGKRKNKQTMWMDKHWNQCEQNFKIVIFVKRHWQDWQALKSMWTKI